MAENTMNSGIDAEEVFAQKNEVIGKISGKKLQLEATPTRLAIKDQNLPDFYFVAEVNQGIFEVSTHTKTTGKDRETRHPDMFAAELVRVALEYFKSKGQTIHTWKAHWLQQSKYEESTNWVQFMNGIGHDLHKDQAILAAAALQTWTGKQAEQNGFTHVESVKQTPFGDIIVHFTKT